MSTSPVSVIDTHVHLMNPALFTYRDLDSIPSLCKPFFPKEFRAATEGINITKMVFAEVAAPYEKNLEEVAWVESLVADEPRIQAIMARVEMNNPQHRRTFFDHLGKHPLIRSVRDLIQGQGPGYCTTVEYVKGSREMAERGIAVELCCFAPELDDVIKLVKQCPDTLFILDHLGKPRIKEGIIAPWCVQMDTLASFENVICKVSGLLTEAHWTEWTPEQIIRCIEHVTRAFGTDRLIYGGDWPVCNLAGDYKQWFDVVEAATGSWTAGDREKFYRTNAERIYRLA